MIYIFGHKNPDTDSVAAAIALADFKNKTGVEAEARVLGPLNKETQYVLDYFGTVAPKLIEDVKPRLKDLNYDRVASIGPRQSLLSAYKIMEKNNIKTLPIVDEDNLLMGIVTMKDIAMWLIKGDFYYLRSTIANIAEDLEGRLLAGNAAAEVEGQISVISYYYDTVVRERIIRKDSIVIVGDRYEIIDYSIESGVKLLIVTGGKEIPVKYLEKARERQVPVLLVPKNTYAAAKQLNHCNYVSIIMKTKDLVKFTENEDLAEVKEELLIHRHSNYPVVTENNEYLGFVGRRHLLNPNRKKVILVDHNEYAQSVKGLALAEIVEVVDHHKIGDVSTSSPIIFRNLPVGSTCTIVFKLFKEEKVPLTRPIAGLLLAGILSDTLSLQSPTTTALDREAVQELQKIAQVDWQTFALEMFKAGTSLEGQNIAEIFYKDFKEFGVKNRKVGIGQVFTLDMENIFNRQAEFLDFIAQIHQQKDYFLTLLLVTDILRKGSYLFYKCNNGRLLANTFNKEVEQGVFIEGVVSRKKQVIPQVIEALNNLEM
ncbi:MAG TPA: putative manganese-dependent inorganic diphosphatase [Peptococcaceae bacterium]|nr:putative manganese-dependent inorganic diphosphatase [Peptococcaceae bacterium]HPZ71064.1 putative manganese-dependent inorganic diphosphatase [Peptococcaceae bacterium]HQD53774.1 putative manganese-dependent inorganic diphosphatase [Peptococcaceae bacterium]